MGVVKNQADFMAVLARKNAAIKPNMERLMRTTTKFVHESILALTPVNTGRTIASYAWSVGSPDYRSVDPIQSGETRGTNSMSLGPEPRRGANEAIANASYTSLDFSNPFQKFIIANAAPAVIGLEQGILPMGGDYTPRSPYGMFRITMEATLYNLSGVKL